jgi:uncharacterized protein HemX
MCPPAVAAALIGVAGSAVITKYQQDQQNAKMEKRQKELDAKSKAEKNAMDRNMESAENTPLLLTKGKAKGAKGISQLKVAKGGSGGYSSLGMGGSGGTGLNIATGG